MGDVQERQKRPEAYTPTSCLCLKKARREEVTKSIKYVMGRNLLEVRSSFNQIVNGHAPGGCRRQVYV
jgi:hypothetical protein